MNKFKIKKPELDNDGTEKFIVKTRLMMKLLERDDDEGCSDDCIDNSFEEEGYN